VSENRFERIYVGWVSEAGRADLLTAPKAPSNYKDPDKIKEYIKVKEAERSNRAASTPGAMNITRIVACADSDELVFSSVGEDAVDDFVNFLQSRVAGFAPGNFIRRLASPEFPPVVVFRARFLAGIAFHLFRQPKLAISASVTGSLRSKEFNLPASLLREEVGKQYFIDPYAELVQYGRAFSQQWPDDVDEQLSLGVVVRLFFPGVVFANDAAIAKALCLRMGL